MREDTEREGESFYWPVSPGTATILTRTDGYASYDILADELKQHQAEATKTLPRGAVRCDVKAHVEKPVESGEQATLIEGTSLTPQLPLTARVLSAADMVFVDGPLTLGYNCLVPFMAPVLFFQDFLKNE